jgi:type III secretion protein R
VNDDLLSRPFALIVALAIVSLLPFVFMSVTAFVKISTVLQIVRSAVGAQSVPSNTVVLALATALTFLAMAPVGSRIAARAAPILSAREKDTAVLVREGIDAVREPMREFLGANASAREKGRFLTIARDAQPAADRPSVTDHDLPVLVPAFVVTELGEAFAIGFLLFLPFLIVDLVVANILLALGMQTLSPTQVSLPFKLLLFVAIDGWGLLSQALVAGYR